MTTFAPRAQQPVAAALGAPLPIPFTSTAPASAPSPTDVPPYTVAPPARGRFTALLAGLRRRPSIDRAHDAVYRDDDGGAGDDGGWD